MKEQSENHYYDDGDVLIFAKNTTFRVHRSILALASPTLADKIQEERGNKLPFINIPDVPVNIIETTLSILYPRYFIMPTWGTIDELLNFSLNYSINKIYVAGVSFLEQNFKKNPMYAFYLANKYQLSFIFEETSKLVLDKFDEYKEETAFKRLPHSIQSELSKRHSNFIHSFANLSIDHFLSNYKHKCGNPAFHNKELNNEIEPRVLTLLDLPQKKSPSIVWRTMSDPISVTGGIDCNNYFMVNHLPRRLKIIFGNLKCLESDNNEKSPDHYIYIKMKKTRDRKRQISN